MIIAYVYIYIHKLRETSGENVSVTEHMLWKITTVKLLIGNEKEHGNITTSKMFVIGRILIPSGFAIHVLLKSIIYTLLFICR